jgi:hypothetical protein
VKFDTERGEGRGSVKFDTERGGYRKFDIRLSNFKIT